jgi:hypothetical protein
MSHMRKVHEHHNQAAAAHARTHQEALRAAAEARAALEAQQSADGDTAASQEGTEDG